MKALFAAGLLLVLTGCATWSTSSVDSRPEQAKPVELVKIAPEKVRITDGDIVDLKYEPVGDITVSVNKTTLFHPNPTPALVNAKLQEKAAELGADAVILVRYGDGGVSLFSWGSLEGKGRAVRYIK